MKICALQTLLSALRSTLTLLSFPSSWCSLTVLVLVLSWLVVVHGLVLLFVLVSGRLGARESPHVGAPHLGACQRTRHGFRIDARSGARHGACVRAYFFFVTVLVILVRVKELVVVVVVVHILVVVYDSLSAHHHGTRLRSRFYSNQWCDSARHGPSFGARLHVASHDSRLALVLMLVLYWYCIVLVLVLVLVLVHFILVPILVLLICSHG